MRVLLSWLADYVNVPVEPSELADSLIMRGLEVAAVETIDPVPLPPWRTAGANAKSDVVIDLEITANRPDCMSILGVAREVATTYRQPLRVRAIGTARASTPSTPDHDDLKVLLEDPEGCPRYSASVADVKVSSSPAWLAGRLTAAGVRSINNIVDITNYALIELGQPMHAFDLERLGGHTLKIRRARPGERIRTLDGLDRTLTAAMLVIADAEKPQAIAGVMGGAQSEVGAATRRVAFESACFESRTVRRTSKILGLKTEASTRFERGTDVNTPVGGLDLAARLLEVTGAGKVVGPQVDRYPSPRAPRRVPLRSARLESLSGVHVPGPEVERILTSLGFQPAANTDGWQVEVPTVRVDVFREADLVEEVARHYGFDRLPATFPVLESAAQPPDVRIPRDQLVRRVLTSAGFSEAVTFAFIDEKAAEAFKSADSDDLVAIDNPLSAKFVVLRGTLIPGLLDSIVHNVNREQPDVQLFEVGGRFSKSNGETRGVGLVWTGRAGAIHWSAPSRQADFFDMKGVVEALSAALALSIRIVPTSQPWLTAGRAGRIVDDGTSQEIGFIGQLAPGVTSARGLPRALDVYAAELDLDQAWILSAERRSESRSEIVRAIRPLPKFPAIVRDLSILVASGLPAGTVRGTIGSAAPDTLEVVREFDRYTGKGVPDGQVSLSFRLTFRSPHRTLTDVEVQQAMDGIIAALVRDHQAIQR